ncbi:YTH domain-containing protein ECT4-like [Impatiens glandulifera]|uniref:YTH domain-containing protein ECT4-like n=1 Tax=Impatiens glandulifera TaxID=253017 RepID=UPI001FB12A96|nr:YTH domain-containing protein ECT4-like [Impatiens glandulifera]XP_047315060.1 YTH domain-containing protein ECT4-like [Impatiens glandulifera]
MAGEKRSDCSKTAKQDMVTRKSGNPSGVVTSGVKGGIQKVSVQEQGACYLPTSYCDYYYPGYNGNFTQFDDQGYISAGGGQYAGYQPDDSSMLYYIPAYIPYTGPFVGFDGQQPPYYCQHPVSYGSWNPTYATDFSYGTSAGKNTSVKSNGYNSVKSSNTTIATKISTTPFESKSRQSSQFPSSFNKSMLHSQHHQPLRNWSKISSGYPSAGQGIFVQNSSTNYRPNHKVWNSNNRYKPRDVNGQFESSAELTRGPRVQINSNPPNMTLEDSTIGLSGSIQRDKYNLQDFETDYIDARFYVIKSYSEDDVHKCIKYDVWSSTPNGNKKLDTAFDESEAKMNKARTKCPIFLFFSVNGSGQFVGVAEMTGQVDFNKNMDFWQLDKWNGFFPVKWHIVKDVPNAQLRHIILENNENKDVTYSRDTQEIGLKQGLEMLKIFKNYEAKTSLLDDVTFYENRQKLQNAKGKSSKNVAPVVELVKNLSLNPQPPKGSGTLL